MCGKTSSQNNHDEHVDEHVYNTYLFYFGIQKAVNSNLRTRPYTQCKQTIYISGMRMHNKNLDKYKNTDCCTHFVN